MPVRMVEVEGREAMEEEGMSVTIDIARPVTASNALSFGGPSVDMRRGSA